MLIRDFVALRSPVAELAGLARERYRLITLRPLAPAVSPVPTPAWWSEYQRLLYREAELFLALGQDDYCTEAVTRLYSWPTLVSISVSRDEEP